MFFYVLFNFFIFCRCLGLGRLSTTNPKLVIRSMDSNTVNDVNGNRLIVGPTAYDNARLGLVRSPFNDLHNPTNTLNLCTSTKR